MGNEKFRLKNRFWLWIAGAVLAAIYLSLRVTGRIRIRHPKRFPQWRGRLIIASNHPSLWEPFVLGAMFCLQYLVSLEKWAPWSTPDKTNYGEKWPWFKAVFGQIMILVPRDKKAGRDKLRAFREMQQVLEREQNIIMFPEGGRTNSAEEGAIFTSATGKRLRGLTPGVGRLAASTGATIVPMWVHGTEHVLPRGCWFPRFWRPVTIVIGKRIKPARTQQNLSILDTILTQRLKEALLALADETVS